MEVCAGTHRLVGVLHLELLQMFLLQQKHSGHLGQPPGPLVSQFSPVMFELFIQGPVSQDLMSNPYNIYPEGANRWERLENSWLAAWIDEERNVAG